MRVIRWVRYSVLRFGLFALLFAALMLLNVVWWVAALFATVIAFAVSYIFLSRQREDLAADVRKRMIKKAPVDSDAESEDAAWDSPSESKSQD